MKTKVDVRPAVPSDIPTILDFIQQLANFEKCPERVLATHATLAKTLGLESEPTAAEVSIEATQLRPGQFAKCVIAQVDGKDAGLAIFFYNYSTWLSAPGIYLEDLFVDPSFRSLGVGSALLSYLGRHAEAIGAGRIDWAVLKWNEGARKFYRETCGGEELDEWLGVRVEGEDKIEKLITL